MSMGLIYKGGFYSYADKLYDVYIYQEGYSGSATNVGFTDTPLTIEWAETDKLEPVQSSSAKLQLMSDTDRQFVGLYTIKAGSIRLDVYREGTLYWSGTLDPELYTEPFAYNDGYGVELTFSDFAILDRINFGGTGFKTIREIIEESVSATQISEMTVEEHISTKLFDGSSSNLLDATSVQSQNFYDEDDEPMTVREVLEETLRPFALRIIQKAGAIHVYDLNALYNDMPAEAVTWDSDDSTLSVDTIYNNVSLKYSPYERTTMLEGTVDPDTVAGRQITTYFSTNAGSNDEIGFYTVLSDSAKGLEKHANAKFYRIDPVYSGESEAGVAWTVETFASRNAGKYNSYVQDPSATTGEMLIKVPDTPFLTYIGATGSDNYRLKISLKVLFDPRYNPFEEADTDNEEGNWKEQQDRANFAYVPIKLTLRDGNGNALYHYANNAVKNSESFANPGEKAYWKAGEAAWGDAWLCWYQGNRKNESGLGGWQTNKQIIGYYRNALPALFDKRGSGELIKLPPVSGYVEMQIGTGIPVYDYGKETKQSNYDQCRWLLYKEPKIEIVEKTGNGINTKDIEYKAWLNVDAEEGLNIDTVLGTMLSPSPAALGQLFDSSNYQVRSSYYRAGVTDLIEKLLIGTVYTQYATPHKTLSGTVELLNGFGTYTDKHEPGAYILLSETQDLRAEQSNVKMVQFEADNYQGIKYDE